MQTLLLPYVKSCNMESYCTITIFMKVSFLVACNVGQVLFVKHSEDHLVSVNTFQGDFWSLGMKLLENSLVYRDQL